MSITKCQAWKSYLLSNTAVQHIVDPSTKKDYIMYLVVNRLYNVSCSQSIDMFILVCNSIILVDTRCYLIFAGCALLNNGIKQANFLS